VPHYSSRSLAQIRLIAAQDNLKSAFAAAVNPAASSHRIDGIMEVGSVLSVTGL